MGLMKIAVVLPTYNEEESIGAVIDELKALSCTKIYVVDSRSKDNTVKIAREKKVEIIEVNKRGKAIAVKEALKKLEEDAIVIIDADGSYSIDAIPLALKKLEECDVVVGNRFAGGIEKGAMSFINKFGNRFLSLTATLLFKKSISDVCSGFWAMKKEVYKTINIDAKHFELEANLFIEVVKHGFKLCEIPVKYKKRKGRSKLSILDGLRIFTYMLSKRLGI